MTSGPGNNGTLGTRGLPALRESVLLWLLPPALYCLASLGLLYVDYNLFHFTVETGSVVIGLMALLVASVSRRFGNSSLLLIACTGLGWVALFDLLHIMAYEGMGLLPGSTANLAVQLWLGGRLLQALALLAAVLLLQWQVRLLLVHGACALFTLLILSGIFSGRLPAAFVPGAGLTSFKIGAEFVIIALLILTAVQIQRRRGRFTTGKYYGIQLALGTMVLSELCFTLYENLFDQFNEAGHLLKVFSYWFLFRALVEQTLLQPFQDRNSLLQLLGERLKELRCLNELARLTQLHEKDIPALLAALVELLPSAMLHDKLARVSLRSSLGNFGVEPAQLPAERSISVPLLIDELPVGTLSVGYPPQHELPAPLFLDEERSMLDLVGQRINAVLARQHSSDTIRQLNRLYRMLSGVNRAVVHSSSQSRLLWDVFTILRDSQTFGFIAIAERHQEQADFTLVHVHGLPAALQANLGGELRRLAAQQWPPAPGLRRGPVTLGQQDLSRSTLGAALAGSEARELALLPVTVNEALLGLILVSALAGDEFSTEQERLLGELVEDVGFALSHLQQGRRLQEAEVRVEHSERRYEVLFNQSPVPMVLLDAAAEHIIARNRAYEAWLGAPLCEIGRVQEWFVRIVDEPGRIETLQRQLLENAGKSFAPFGYFQFGETRLRNSAGRTLTTTARLTAVEDRILVVFNDITQLKEKEERLRESESRFRNMIEDTLLGVLVVQDGRFVYVNPAFCRQSAWQQHELIGEPLDAFLTTTAATGSRTVPATAQQRQFGFRCRDGQSIQLHASVGVMPWNEGSAELMIVQDVTEKLRYEQQLQESVALLENLAQQVPGVIYQFRFWPDGRSCFPYATRNLDEIYELSPEEVRNDAGPVFLRLHPADVDRVRHSIEVSARDLSVWHCEYRVVLPRQGTRWRSGFARPQRLEDGSTLWHGFIEDATARKEMEDELRRSNALLQRSVSGTLEIIARIMDQRDPYTAGHQHRVGQIARLIGHELGLGQQAEEMLELTGVVHDVGKIAVPTEILTKPTRLSDIELQIVKGHAAAGYEMLKDTNLPRVIIDAIHQHHERLDGSGYPQGLQAEQICLEARIIAVADVLESMSSHRPYRPSLGVQRAVAELQRGRGSSYDPAIVDIALRIVEEGRLPRESAVD